MDDLALTVRRAGQDDAAGIARVYIDAWHDTYPDIVPHDLLRAMTLKGQTARWQGAIKGREIVLVAEHFNHGVIGVASAGKARDPGLGFDGEVYALYVDPLFLGRGAGRALLAGAFAALRERGCQSCVIWAHARNNARFFYEAMGGRLIAERTIKLGGAPAPEAAFGWKRIAENVRSGPHAV